MRFPCRTSELTPNDIFRKPNSKNQGNGHLFNKNLLSLQFNHTLSTPASCVFTIVFLQRFRISAYLLALHLLQVVLAPYMVKVIELENYL